MIEEVEDLQETYCGAETFKLGDSKELWDRLGGLVRSGYKAATYDALANYNTEPEAMPKVGRCDITTEWQAVPALFIRTIRIDKTHFCDVSEEIALAEGENLDLDGWREEHTAFLNTTWA
jgi:uncharacterized protein YhfF